MNNFPQISICQISQILKKVYTPQPARLVIVDTPPKFPGGKKALARYFKEKLANPEADYPVRNIGSVCLSFVVDPWGRISEIKIVKSLNFACNFAAFNLVKNMPRWQPATANGQAIAFESSVAIHF